MHSKSWALAAALAVLSTASAVHVERPRIYFPRHVKRQFQNATITRAETFPSPESTPFGGTAPITTKREPIPDEPALLPLPIPLPSIETPTSEPPSDPGITTIYLETSTIIVTPTEVLPIAVIGTTNGLPEIVILPTPTSEPATSSAAGAEEPSSPTGILLAPTGVVTPSTSAPAARLPAESPVVDEPAASPSNANATESAVVQPSPTSSPAEEAVAKPIETTTSSPVVEPSENATVTTTPPALNVTTPTETVVQPTEEPETRPKNPLENPLEPIISLITSILPPLPTPPLNVTEPPQNTTEVAPVPVTTEPPPVTTEPPAPTPDPTPVEETTSSPPPDTVTIPPTPTEPPVPPPRNTTSEVPISTPPVEEPVTEVPPGPGNITTTEQPHPPTSIPFTIPTNITNVPEPTDAPDQTSVFTSVPATATITDQESWLPTTVVTEQVPTANQPTEALAPTTTATLPSNLPKVISPSDPGTVEQPDNSVLLQIGFLCSLNYKYVSKTPRAAAQMFSLLPQALSYATGMEASQIKMQKLVPLDTTGTMGCFTTLARFYYPASFVDTLRMDIKIAYSALYTNPDLLIYNFTQQINPAIDVIPSPEEESNTSENGADATSTANPGGDIFNQPQTSQTPKEMVTTAGIVVGSVGVAFAYGAAMFLVARRYKKKKQAHRRSSSVTHGSNGSSGMRYTGSGSPALMGGALMSREFSSYGGVTGGRNSHGSSGRNGSGSGRGRDSHGSGRSGAGNSARTAIISAPVAAENSLGWN